MMKRDIEEREMDEGIYPARRSVIRSLENQSADTDV